MGFLKKKNPPPFFEYLRKEGKGKRREEKEEMKGCDCERICFFWDDFLAFCFYCLLLLLLLLLMLLLMFVCSFLWRGN